MTGWNEAGDMLNTIYKSHVYKTLYKDLSKFVRKNVRNMEFDREYWLHRVGLTPYRPTKAAFGGMSLFLLGAVAGGVAGLFLAPKTGPEMRTTMKERAKTLMNRQGLTETTLSSSDTSPLRA